MNLLLLFVIMGASVILGGFFALRHIRKYIAFRNIPLTRSGPLRPGSHVMIRGVAGKAITFNPLTLIDCVFWRVKVEEEVGSAKNKHWVTIDNQSSQIPFEIIYEKDVILVEPDRAEIILMERKSEGASGPERLGIVTRGSFGSTKKLKTRESSIFTGDKILICGDYSENGEKKSLSVDNTGFMLISDRSMQEVNKVLLWPAIMPILICVMMGVGLCVLFVR